MTTNQEGKHEAVRAITGTARSYNEDWHALFDDDDIAAAVTFLGAKQGLTI